MEKSKNEVESNLELEKSAFEMPSPEELEKMSEMEIIEFLRRKPNTESYIKNRELEMCSGTPVSEFQLHGRYIKNEFSKLAEYNPYQCDPDNYFTDFIVDKITKEANLNKYNDLINKLLDIKKDGNDMPTALIYKHVPIVINMLKSYAKTKDATVIFYSRIITILLSYILQEKSKKDLYLYLKQHEYSLTLDMSHLVDCVLDYIENVAWNRDKDRTAYTTAPNFYSYMCDIRYESTLEPMFMYHYTKGEITFGKVMCDIDHFIKESEYLNKNKY